jgi:hypothetical protein
MLGPSEVAMPHTVGPDETVELRVSLVAPMTPNTFSSEWMLQDESGYQFGIGLDGNQPLAVIIVVRPIFARNPT